MRGIAIIIMVCFHFIYDINTYYDAPIDYSSGIVYYSGKIAASMFIIIAGISCTLSRDNIKRGLYILFWALVVTVSTSIAVPGSNIIFGILHLLGVSILLFPLFRDLNPYLLFFLGSVALFFGFAADNVVMPHNLFSPFGLLGQDFYAADYYPLFPWFGLFLYGIALGRLKYIDKKSILGLNPEKSNLLDLSGRHSLTIYLVHQPLLLSLLFICYKF